LWRQSPFTRHHVVARQVPPEIIVQVLRSSIDFPAAQDVKRLAIHDKHARRTFSAVLAATAERADVDTLWTAMDSVGSRVAGLFENLFRLDDFLDFRPSGIRFRIHDINT